MINKAPDKEIQWQHASPTWGQNLACELPRNRKNGEYIRVGITRQSRRQLESQMRTLEQKRAGG